MSSLPTQQNNDPATNFLVAAQRAAWKGLVSSLGKEAAEKTIARFGITMQQAARSAKRPQAIFECSPESVGNCLAMSVISELPPGGPFPMVWLVPKAGQLQWWVSHRGVKELARREGYDIVDQCVYEGDFYKLIYTQDGPEIRHEPIGPVRNSTTLIRVYCIIRKGGRVIAIRDLDRAQIDQRRDVSLMKNEGPWNAWYDEMALKTVIKYAAARGDVTFGSEVVQRAVLNDEDAYDPSATVQQVQPAPTTRPLLGVDALRGALSPTSAPEPAIIEGEPMSEVQASEAHNGHHPSWESDRPRFCAAIGEVGNRRGRKVTYEEVKAYLSRCGEPKPSDMEQRGRDNLISYLQTDQGWADFLGGK